MYIPERKFYPNYQLINNKSGGKSVYRIGEGEINWK